MSTPLIHPHPMSAVSCIHMQHFSQCIVHIVLHVLTSMLKLMLLLASLIFLSSLLLLAPLLLLASFLLLSSLLLLASVLLLTVRFYCLWHPCFWCYKVTSLLLLASLLLIFTRCCWHLCCGWLPSMASIPAVAGVTSDNPYYRWSPCCRRRCWHSHFFCRSCCCCCHCCWRPYYYLMVSSIQTKNIKYIRLPRLIDFCYPTIGMSKIGPMNYKSIELSIIVHAYIFVSSSVYLSGWCTDEWQSKPRFIFLAADCNKTIRVTPFLLHNFLFFVLSQSK